MSGASRWLDAQMGPIQIAASARATKGSAHFFTPHLLPPQRPKNFPWLIYARRVSLDVGGIVSQERRTRDTMACSVGEEGRYENLPVCPRVVFVCVPAGG